jgi:hypothetical protein
MRYSGDGSPEMPLGAPLPRVATAEPYGADEGDLGAHAEHVAVPAHDENGR